MRRRFNRRLRDRPEDPRGGCQLRAPAAARRAAVARLQHRDRRPVDHRSRRRRHPSRWAKSPSAAGEYSTQCTVDSNEKFSESNEDNNTTTTEFRAVTRNPENYEAHRLGGRAQPTRQFESFEFGWQADCSLVPMPWVDVREVGNMMHLPFGELPDPEQKNSASAWFDKVKYSNKPRLSSMPKKLPLACTVTVGAFADMPTTPGATDRRPVKTIWTGSQQLALPNPEK